MSERPVRLVRALAAAIAVLAVVSCLAADLPGPLRAPEVVPAAVPVTAPGAPGHGSCPASTTRCAPSSPLLPVWPGLGIELACLVGLLAAALPLVGRYRRRRRRSSLPGGSPAVLLRPPRHRTAAA